MLGDVGFSASPRTVWSAQHRKSPVPVLLPCNGTQFHSTRLSFSRTMPLEYSFVKLMYSDTMKYKKLDMSLFYCKTRGLVSRNAHKTSIFIIESDKKRKNFTRATSQDCKELLYND